MQRRLSGLCAISAALFGACAPTVAAQPYPAGAPEAGESAEPQAPPARAQGMVELFDRQIDLRPFLVGFPYKQFEASIESDRLFYLDAREAYTLRMLSLSGGEAGAPLPPLEGGVAVGDSDWSKRSLWGLHYVPSRKELWLHADANNDEKMNLWVLDLGAEGHPQSQRTQADYVYAFGFSDDDRYIAYLPRSGTQAPFKTCLHVLDTQSGDDRQVTCDSDALRFTWGSPVFSPDNKEVYFNAQSDGDRTRVQLVRVELEAKAPRAKPITDPKVKRSSPSVIEGWVDGDKLLFTANDDGYRNVYAYARKRRRVQQVTRFTEDIQSATLIDGGVFLSHGTPAGSTLEFVDTKTGQAKARGAMPGKVSILDGHGDRVVWVHRAPDVVFEMLSTRVTQTGESARFENSFLTGPSAELTAQMVQCSAEAVRYETFDQDPSTGATRKLHAFLLRPKKPMGPDEGAPWPLAMIRSFYGGDNSYNRFDHIMCAAGITLLSPAVRGSSGFGKDFAALNNRDLGGDEIVDLFYGARYLERSLGLAPEQIGVYGRSHGGYATMRALTFDPATNDRNESYAFGFGLADAGFSNIVAFHDATNIPDWVVLESGDPAVPDDRKRMLARSPVNGVARLAAPIFLLHGAADWRVPVQGSRNFAEAALKLGKSVTYVEVEGQGHHVEGIDRIATNFQSRFDFLMSLVRAPVPAPADKAARP